MNSFSMVFLMFFFSQWFLLFLFGLNMAVLCNGKNEKSEFIYHFQPWFLRVAAGGHTIIITQINIIIEALTLPNHHII